MYRLCLLTVVTVFSPLASAWDAHPAPVANASHAQAQARFSQADGNHDGKLSLAEMQDAQDIRLAERFAKMDANKDGGVSQDEMRQAHRQRREHRHARREAIRAELLALDSNQDRALTRAEIGDRMPRLSENFDRIDGNRDGKITREEMRAAHDARRAQSNSR